MFAVVKTGGKQYRVAQGDTIEVEKLPGDVGEQVDLSEVLLLVDDDENVQIGRPTVSGATVKAEIVQQGRGPKIVVFKMKRRKSYRRKAGHRQPFTGLKIVEIAS
jgi:large subunit ribosomal protein L21